MGKDYRKFWCIGDIVYLRSGGPPMTIKACMNTTPMYLCEWDNGHRKESKIYNGRCLEGNINSTFSCHWSV